MFEDMPISVKLAKRSDDFFDELRGLLEKKERVEFMLNILIGLLDKDFPLYYLSDVPEYYTIIENKDNYKDRAINFLHNNFGLFLELLSLEELKDNERDNLIYLLGKYAIEANLEPQEILKMSFLVFDMILEQKSEKLAKQLLCRYDLESLLIKGGFDKCQKEPYEEVIKFINKNRNFPYIELYLALSKVANLDNSLKIEKDKLLNEADDILSDIDIKNYETVRATIDKCLEKENPFPTQEQTQNITQTVSTTADIVDKG